MMCWFPRTGELALHGSNPTMDGARTENLRSIGRKSVEVAEVLVCLFL